jgi:condensin complex subunit 2
LAPSFAPLQLKKFELEFSVDPLFKKASADFDEGGAKGLLLNHLAIDSHGRIVFDSSDDAGEVSGKGSATRRKGDAIEEEEETELDSTMAETAKEEEEEDEDVEIDIGALGAKFFPNLDRLDEQDICPSLKNFDLGDPSGSMDIPFLKAPEDWRQEREKTEEAGAVGDKSGIFLDDDNPAGFDDDDDLGGFDLPADTGFGEGGEAWARDAAIEPQMRLHDIGLDNEGADGEDGENGAFDPESGDYVVSLGQKGEGGHDDILSYFDQALQKNWAGPEHWRIRKIKDINKAATTAKPRKEKEPFEIDFSSPLPQSVAETIYTPATSTSTISMPKKDWKSKTRNLLPDDKHFNSKQLLRLFLKPKAHMGSRRRLATKSTFGIPAPREEDVPEGEMDEGFWARKEDPANAEGGVQGDYDANFFQDDGLPLGGGMDDEDDMFADARDHFSPAPGESGPAGIANLLNGGIPSSQASDAQTAFGDNPVGFSRRARPEYVQYARVAKKVDVRRLKDEMWRGMGIDLPDLVRLTPLSTSLLQPTNAYQNPPRNEEAQAPSPLPSGKTYNPEDGPLKFTDVMNNLQSVYPKQVMSDISTSYCFICLLHLANEKGLVIDKAEGLEDLRITVDENAAALVGAE